jgi:basic membrane protein A
LNKEEETALTLIETDGCKLISQHADSMGAPTACERKNVPNVSYNGDTSATGVNTYIISSRINWQPYYEFAMKAVRDGEGKIPYDWTGTLANGAVEVFAASKNAAEGTQAKIDEVKAKLIAGEINVFDTATFKVTKGANLNVNATIDENGKLTGYKADVDTDAAFTGDTEVIANGVFQESKFRSAPYFDLRIDGITELGLN